MNKDEILFSPTLLKDLKRYTFNVLQYAEDVLLAFSYSNCWLTDKLVLPLIKTICIYVLEAFINTQTMWLNNRHVWDSCTRMLIAVLLTAAIHWEQSIWLFILLFTVINTVLDAGDKLVRGKPHGFCSSCSLRNSSHFLL